MKKFFVITVVTLFILVFMGSITSLKAAPIVGVIGVTGLGAGEWRNAGGATYAGLYKFGIDTDNNGIYESTFWGWCIDPFRSINYNLTWKAFWYTPSDVAGGSGWLYQTYGSGPPAHGSPNLSHPLENYKMVGWLYDHYVPSITTSQTNDYYADFHEALLYAASYNGTWSGWTTANWLTGAYSTWADDAGFKGMIAAAVADQAYTNGTPPYLYTPKNSSGDGHPRDYVQEIINPVPEPGTLLLLGAGLIGLVGYGKLRISRRKS